MRLIDADAAILDARASYGGVNDAVLMEHFLNSQPTIAPPPNDPLTLEELREMDGEPIWFEAVYDDCKTECGWAIVSTEYERVAGNFVFLRFEDYGTWLAYRRKPKEEE